MDPASLSEWGYIGMFLAGFLAGTVVPFSSEAVLVALLALNYSAIPLLIVASISNWIGGMTTYYVGRLGRIDWLEKYFRVSQKKLEDFKKHLDKYGSYWALLSWVPIMGNVITAALGFFRVKAVPVAIYMMIGKVARYWILIYLTDLALNPA